MVVLCAAGVVAVPTGVAGQLSDVSRVVVGDTVRLRMDGTMRVDARFEGWNSDVMLFEVDGLTGSWPVSVFDLTTLELLTERTSREGFRHGAVLGAISGIFIGAGVGLLLHSTGIVYDEDGPPSQLVTTTLRWSGIGLAVGGLGGGFLGGSRPGRGWVQIELPRS